MSQTVPSQIIHLPKGFSFSAVTAGVKASGRPDLSLIEAAPGTTAAALFTKNRVVAAPVEVGREALAKSRGLIRAVVINSGNANCATGKPGIKACQRICREAAKLLGVRPEQIFPSSTGIIGVPLLADKIVAKLADLISARASTEQGVAQLARAIMTTDTRPKVASAQFRAGKSTISLTGVAKGSGMIHPQLATMLVYILTDVSATPVELKRLLRESCDVSFNCMSVDGDTSTNDTVLLMASGKSGASLKTPKIRDQFSAALQQVCQSLADQIVADGEGVQHIIHLHIEQAKTRDEALRVARAIAHSLLVKTAWAGADPNWGRILSAAGSCGLPLNANHIDIYIGRQRVCGNGMGFPFDEVQAHRDLSQAHCDIRVKLRRGNASVVFQTTDLTAEYVRINADYST
ncbi:MAG: Glutamate N-acetyltransferase [Acidobacteriaceae bacterium]|nr:Glutamate N-acetyltransferase [Acidobacteriaceae bacterium]